MSFFITLVEMTDATRRELETIPKVNSMIHHGLSLAEYKSFLHDLYHIVWHFCPVMAAAAARCSDRFREVRFDLYDRIEEEKGHDSWVLEDIEVIGGDAASARAHPPSAPVQAMIAFNYFGAERVHPCSVLGMLYMLEVVSSVYGGRVSDSIARTLGRNVAAATSTTSPASMPRICARTMRPILFRSRSSRSSAAPACPGGRAARARHDPPRPEAGGVPRLPARPV